MSIQAEFSAPLQCLFEPKRYKVLYGGRGAGRSWGIARALLLLGAQKSIRVLCVRELQNSIEESVHKVLSDQIGNLGLSQFYTIEKTKIRGANGSSFSFDGIKNNTNKIKSYEGIDYCWVEEANKVTKASWADLIPTIRGQTSEIWISFNPELETDYTYQRFTRADDLLPIDGATRFASQVTCPFFESATMFVAKMSWKDNPWFPQVLLTELETDKRRDYDHYLNVWEGHTVQNLEGAVYAKELRQATTDERICKVPYEKDVPVDTAWDLGRADNTAIWFFQRVAMQWRILAYYENSMEDIHHYLRECQSRGYVYGTMYLPHDAKHKKLGYKHSIEEIIRNAGYRVHTTPIMSITDGINAARMVFPNCYFDEERCEDGLNALRHYRYKVIKGQLSEKPLHDAASDGADAFRTFATNIHTARGSIDASRVMRRLTYKPPGFLEAKTGQGWMT